MSYKRLQLAIALFARREGTSATIFFIIATIFTVVSVLLSLHMSVQVEKLRETVVQTETKEAVQASPPVKISNGVRDKLAAFRSVLVSRRDASVILASAWKIAEDESLLPTKASYRMELDAKGKFNRMHIVMPVSGAPANVKMYVYRLLHENIGLALTKMEIHREHANDESVDAELSFILFVE